MSFSIVDVSEPVTLFAGEVRGEPRLMIRCSYGLRERAKRLPSSFWDGVSRCWHVPLSPALVAPVCEAFDGCDIAGDDEWRKLVDESAARRDALASKSGTDLPDMPTSTVGWLHQRRAFHFAKDLRSSGLFIDMGGGKSAVAVGLCDHWNAQRVLVLCPKSVMGVWAKQFTAHSSRQWDFYVANQSGTVATKANTLASFLLRPQIGDRVRVAVVNYDSAWRDRMGPLLLATQWDMLVLDESHKIKSPGGKASRFCARLNKSANKVLALTGTPTPHGPADVYAQYRALDPGIFGTSFSRHKKRYFETRPITEHVDKIVGFRDDSARAEFERKMGSIAIVVPREDMVGVAGKRWALPHSERQCVLEPSSYRKYKDIQRDLITEVEEGIVTADNVLVKGLRLRQATSGYLRTEDGIDSVIGDEKKRLLAEVLDDMPRGEPIVIFAVFHHDLDAIACAAEEAGLRYGELSGRRRDGLTGESTMAEDIDILGCQLQSGGVGIDLTRACFGIYYSIDYNLGNLEQSFARLDRPGQTRPVTFIHLVAVSPFGGNTVDGVTYKALVDRKALNVALLDAIRNKEL